MRIRTIVRILFLLLILYLIFSSWRIISLTAQTPATINGQEFSSIIVIGQGVRNGTLIPDDEHRDNIARLDFAVEIFEQQKEKPKIILSGYGRGYRARDLNNQEALVMYQYLAPKLQEQGYNPDRYLILENQSHHTIENALYVKELEELELQQPLLILAPARTQLRTDLVFSIILKDYDVTIYSLRPQSARERNLEWLRTAGTFVVLLLPGDALKQAVAEWAFVKFADESCRKEGYILNKVICDQR